MFWFQSYHCYQSIKCLKLRKKQHALKNMHTFCVVQLKYHSFLTSSVFPYCLLILAVIRASDFLFLSGWNDSTATATGNWLSRGNIKPTGDGQPTFPRETKANWDRQLNFPRENKSPVGRHPHFRREPKAHWDRHLNFPREPTADRDRHLNFHREPTAHWDRHLNFPSEPKAQWGQWRQSTQYRIPMLPTCAIC